MGKTPRANVEDRMSLSLSGVRAVQKTITEADRAAGKESSAGVGNDRAGMYTYTRNTRRRFFYSSHCGFFIVFNWCDRRNRKRKNDTRARIFRYLRNAFKRHSCVTFSLLRPLRTHATVQRTHIHTRAHAHGAAYVYAN